MTYLYDTEYSADSVEFCPFEPHTGLALIGTYQVIAPASSDQTPDTDSRAKEASSQHESSASDLDNANDDDSDADLAGPAKVKTNRKGKLIAMHVQALATADAEASASANDAEALASASAFKLDAACIESHEMAAILDIKWLLSHFHVPESSSDALYATTQTTPASKVTAKESRGRALFALGTARGEIKVYDVANDVATCTPSPSKRDAVPATASTQPPSLLRLLDSVVWPDEDALTLSLDWSRLPWSAADHTVPDPDDLDGAAGDRSDSDDDEDAVMTRLTAQFAQLTASHGPPMPRLATSHNNGSVAAWAFRPDTARLHRYWTVPEAHGYEAWIVAWDAFQPTVMYSGGDDCRWNVWDTRSPGVVTMAASAKLRSSRYHSMGVTAMQSHPTRPNLLAVGSYDEVVGLWDPRSLRAPLTTFQTGGGVWRLKWHPTDPDRLLACCMHNGNHVLVYDATTSDLSSVQHHTAHSSLAYGGDWYRGAHPLPLCFRSPSDQRATTPTATTVPATTSVLGTCSFYDHEFRLWTHPTDTAAPPHET
ncbi:hypothetical protein CXG81DRAFT_16427 [Caulochytrium protostelioides]|uniref:methylated diphthine methylhydrolase n=1 Tax=Caulochytrium protostelioides TaxID=1555241 RepID=A0A4P9XF11_9FUNG|nr:hypothetical protein CXG81DRAFT_16427 [Caulochytrium protostelioides]|eukprot:RKP04144.1 hypothetical protein CXG81DRAFT_16427 [Caulochytrium protostelioides]